MRDRPTLIPTSALTTTEIAEIRRRIGPHPVWRLYFETALEALERGEDNRAFLFSKTGGLIMAIAFNTLTVMTAMSPLSESELAVMIQHFGATELHLDEDLAKRVRAAAGDRVNADLELLFYKIPEDIAADDQPAIERLGPEALQEIRDFTRRWNPSTIFSDWMIDLPTSGIRSDGELVALAGVIAEHWGSRTRMLGNFITAPDARGRGHAKALCRALVAKSRATGFKTITLCTTADNIGARRAYEAVGFRRVEVRRQIDLAP